MQRVPGFGFGKLAFGRRNEDVLVLHVVDADTLGFQDLWYVPGMLRLVLGRAVPYVWSR